MFLEKYRIKLTACIVTATYKPSTELDTPQHATHKQNKINLTPLWQKNNLVCNVPRDTCASISLSK